MAPEILRKNLTFWGTVGGVMAALKLKEQWDDYRQVPSDESGRILLQGDEEEGLAGHVPLDTEIPMARPARPRSKKDCCVCCGMRCGLFWKAFGIVCLLFLGWQSIKLAIWMFTPSPTGLEGMPKFSTSLGCPDAPYTYNADHTTWTVPVGASDDHAINLSGAAFGTLTIDDAPSAATDIEFTMVLRASDKSLLDSVTLALPDSKSEIDLTTPRIPSDSSACMRYDITLRVPSNLKKLAIQARSTTQVRFAPGAQVALDKLSVTMHGTSADNMLLPSTGVQAKDLALEMTGGWLVGQVGLVDSAKLQTQRGSAMMNVEVYPMAIDTEDYDTSPPEAVLESATGSGRTNIFYISDLDSPHRPISSRHLSSLNGDVYLTYKKAGFNGHVELKAKSYTATGVNGLFEKNGTTPWVGNADGGDYLFAESRGWVGLYF